MTEASFPFSPWDSYTTVICLYKYILLTLSVLLNPGSVTVGDCKAFGEMDNGKLEKSV